MKCLEIYLMKQFLKYSTKKKDYIMGVKITNCTEILLMFLSHLACCPFELSFEQKHLK